MLDITGVSTTAYGSASVFDVANIDKIITIPAGQSDARILIPIAVDDEVEEDETFTLTLSLVEGGEIGLYPSLEVTIIDVTTEITPVTTGMFVGARRITLFMGYWYNSPQIEPFHL